MMQDEAFAFFQKLRRFIQHRRIPFLSASFSITNTPKGEIQQKTVNLDVEDLLNWKDKRNKAQWNSSIRNYLLTFGKSMDIKIPLKNHYNKLVKYLYQVRNKVKEIKKKQISELNDIKNEIYTLEKKLMGKYEFEIEEL